MNSSHEDILKEIFNVSVGKAASILSEIVNRKIGLDVPDIKILKSADQINIFEFIFHKEIKGALMVSSISFREKLTGQANLIFPADKMRHFIDLCINENSINTNNDFNDIDFDIIKEIGNIILNSIIGEISNLIDVQLTYTLPVVTILEQSNLQTIANNQEYDYIIILSITFKIDKSEIVGAVLINLTLNSLDEILSRTSMLESGLE